MVLIYSWLVYLFFLFLLTNNLTLVQKRCLLVLFVNIKAVVNTIFLKRSYVVVPWKKNKLILWYVIPSIFPISRIYIYIIIKDVVFLWNYWLFFNNLFCCLKFYFEQFNYIKANYFWFLRQEWNWEKRDQNDKDGKHGWRAWDFMKNTFKSSIFKNNTIIQCVSLYILKNCFCYKNLFVLFFNPWLEKKGVAEFRQLKRKFSFKSFPTIKMNFFCFHMFHVMLTVCWWCFRASILLKK